MVIIIHIKIYESTLRNLKKLAMRFKVRYTVVIRAAIRYFLENAPYKFVFRKPKMYDKTRSVSLVITPELDRRITEYAILQHTTKTRIITQAIYDFLKLDYTKQYGAMLSETIEEFREKRQKEEKREESGKERLKELEQLPPDKLIQVSFRCETKLHHLLDIEAIKEKQSISYVVRRAVVELLQKYENNIEEVKKLVEKESEFSGSVLVPAKMPVEYVARLIKLANAIQTTKTALMRIAIVEYLTQKGVLDEPKGLKGETIKSSSENNDNITPNQ
ncbi:MAG: hypothetical protein QXV58_15140 [Saccharolobus sp.]|uniref:hypothetical protein n=1 Tax=Saccharolobus sp. TaxID=2100761 RepID=UPI00315EF406